MSACLGAHESRMYNYLYTLYRCAAVCGRPGSRNVTRYGSTGAVPPKGLSCAQQGTVECSRQPSDVHPQLTSGEEELAEEAVGRQT